MAEEVYKTTYTANHRGQKWTAHHILLAKNARVAIVKTKQFVKKYLHYTATNVTAEPINNKN
ncbi:MAG: hypothetical protein ACI4M6_06090 [Christensenellaceae bacterium]